MNTYVKNFNDIEKHIFFLEKKLERLDRELKSINNILHFLTSKEARIRKQEIKEELESINATLDEYDEFLQEATTFDKNDLDKFFVQYFSLLYGVNYSVEKDIKDSSEGMHYVLTDFIASERDLKELKKEFNLRHKVDLDYMIDLCEDTCICLGGKNPYPLLNGINLNDELEEFPELYEAVKILVDLKIADPSLSNQERLALCLRIMTNRFTQKEDTFNTSISFSSPNVERTQKYEKKEAIIPTKPQVTKMEEKLGVNQTQKTSEEVKMLRKSLLGKHIKY